MAVSKWLRKSPGIAAGAWSDTQNDSPIAPIKAVAAEAAPPIALAPFLPRFRALGRLLRLRLRRHLLLWRRIAAHALPAKVAAARIPVAEITAFEILAVEVLAIAIEAASVIVAIVETTVIAAARIRPVAQRIANAAHGFRRRALWRHHAAAVTELPVIRPAVIVELAIVKPAIIKPAIVKPSIIEAAVIVEAPAEAMAAIEVQA
jgi:hypothetical protein